MRVTIYMMSVFPLMLFASQAGAANALPDVEVNLDVLGAISPAPLVPAPASTVPTSFSVPAVPVVESPKLPTAAPVGASAATSPNLALAPATATAAAEHVMNGYVQAGGNYSSLSDGLGTWNGQYVRGEVQTDSDNRWNGEVLHQREFGQQGYFISAGNTHNFDEDWYSTVGAGWGSPGADFLLKYRVDAFLNRKWLDTKQLITTVGLGADHARDSHRDASVFLGATYYFQAPWIVQGGVRFNESNPGSVHAVSSVFGVTQGYNKNYYLSASYGFGKEAYQILGAGSTLSSFNSQIVGLGLRKWLSEDWGFDVRGEHYFSPSYVRDGINFGIFKEF